MNRQPAFCGKQPNTQFFVKRQTMLSPVSNSRNFCNASPSFRLSDCKHVVSFSICIQRTSNLLLQTKEGNRSARRLMPLHKKTPQIQARRYNDEFHSAMHHTTTQHVSSSFLGSKRLSTLHTVDTSHRNPATARNRGVQVECTAEIPLPNRLHTILSQGSTKEEQTGSQSIL